MEFNISLNIGDPGNPNLNELGQAAIQDVILDPRIESAFAALAKVLHENKNRLSNPGNNLRELLSKELDLDQLPKDLKTALELCCDTLNKRIKIENAFLILNNSQQEGLLSQLCKVTIQAAQSGNAYIDFGILASTTLAQRKTSYADTAIQEIFEGDAHYANFKWCLAGEIASRIVSDPTESTKRLVDVIYSKGENNQLLHVFVSHLGRWIRDIGFDEASQESKNYALMILEPSRDEKMQLEFLNTSLSAIKKLSANAQEFFLFAAKNKELSSDVRKFILDNLLPHEMPPIKLAKLASRIKADKNDPLCDWADEYITRKIIPAF